MTNTRFEVPLIEVPLTPTQHAWLKQIADEKETSPRDRFRLAMHIAAAIMRRRPQVSAPRFAEAPGRDPNDIDSFIAELAADPRTAASANALADALRAVDLALEALENQRAALQEAEAVAQTKVSDKNVSAFEVCAGDVRWRKDGLLEQLWRINYVGPTGAVEKTTEEWQLVPEF
jgi:hypothetical protein